MADKKSKKTGSKGKGKGATATKDAPKGKSPKKDDKKDGKKPAAKPAPVELALASSRKASGEHLQGGYAISSKGAKKADGVMAVLNISDIDVAEGFNPRVSLGDITALVATIKRQGLVNPILVRPNLDSEGHYWLVAGERRLAALVELEMTEIQAVIRMDLAEDDARARAIAVAENSGDARKELNYIEIGNVAKELRDDFEWTPQRIADETGYQASKIRRALTIVDGPEDVQERVASGDLSMISAVELTKMDDSTREKIRDQLKKGISKEEIKKLAKAAAKEDGASAPAGKAPQKQKGKNRSAAMYTWQGSKSKQAMLQELCYYLLHATEEENETGEWHEIRGGIGAILWDRGDLDSAILPPIKAADAENPKKAASALKKFNAVVKAESAKYTPEDDGESK